MHRATFFSLGRGRAVQRKKISGWGGAGSKILGRGRVTVKLGAFSRQGRAVLKPFGAGAAIFPGAGAVRVSLTETQ